MTSRTLASIPPGGLADEDLRIFPDRALGRGTPRLPSRGTLQKPLPAVFTKPCFARLAREDTMAPWLLRNASGSLGSKRDTRSGMETGSLCLRRKRRILSARLPGSGRTGFNACFGFRLSLAFGPAPRPFGRRPGGRRRPTGRRPAGLLLDRGLRTDTVLFLALRALAGPRLLVPRAGSGKSRRRDINDRRSLSVLSFS